MLGKLRTQLMLVFLIFGLLNAVLVIFYMLESKRKTAIEDLENQIHQMEVLIHSSTREINNFFTYDTKNPHYFIENASTSLNNYRHQLFIIRLVKNKLISSVAYERINGNNQIEKLNTDLDSLAIVVDDIASLVFKRGYKDYGIEGQMREHAHNLEALNDVPLIDILMLRRHEKDYIIRNENKYIELFEKQVCCLRCKVENNLSINKTQKRKVLYELDGYALLFKQLVNFDANIGLNTNTGKKALLDKRIRQLFNDVALLKNSCHVLKVSQFKKLKQLSITILFSIVVFSLLLSVRVSKLVTRRISLLSSNIQSFVQNCFSILEPVPVTMKNDEVGGLIKNVEVLKQNIYDYIHHLEVKVAQRTEEINTQKEQILEQNVKMIDSLRYAINIQEAILPHKAYIGKTFPEHFIYYRPKDLVSGDFYWFKRITRKKVDYSIFVVADCTGHGVPGAFMSMLGVAFLNEIVALKNNLDANEILNQLRDKIIDNLVQSNNSKKISDGMDVALIKIDHTNNTLQFSGAFRDLIHVSKGSLNRIVGDRMPIGNHVKEVTPFTLHEVSYKKGDMLYLFTDGYADQHGGVNNRKYLRKNMRNLLQSMSYAPIDKQKTLLDSELNNYMAKNDQTDDILVAGIRMP